MKNEFALAFNEVLEEKQLPREIILSAIESAMVSAYRRAVNASNAQQVEAKINPDTGEVSIFVEKEVVEDVQDERTEVLLEDARRVSPEINLGDMAIVESTPKDFGRVAAQTARQVIQQRIREAERQMQSDYYEKQVGEIVSGVVQAVNMTQGATIGLDMKAEGLCLRTRRSRANDLKFMTGYAPSSWKSRKARAARKSSFPARIVISCAGFWKTKSRKFIMELLKFAPFPASRASAQK